MGTQKCLVSVKVKDAGGTDEESKGDVDNVVGDAHWEDVAWGRPSESGRMMKCVPVTKILVFQPHLHSQGYLLSKLH